jgi:hypothetical protein
MCAGGICASTCFYGALHARAKFVYCAPAAADMISYRIEKLREVLRARRSGEESPANPKRAGAGFASGDQLREPPREENDARIIRSVLHLHVIRAASCRISRDQHAEPWLRVPVFSPGLVNRYRHSYSQREDAWLGFDDVTTCDQSARPGGRAR